MASSPPAAGFDGAAASLLRADSFYWVTVALAVNGFVDRACVLASADFMISPARAGTQTHMDLIEVLLCEA